MEATLESPQIGTISLFDWLKRQGKRIKQFLKQQKVTIITAGGTALFLDIIMLVISIIGGGLLGAALA